MGRNIIDHPPEKLESIRLDVVKGKYSLHALAKIHEVKYGTVLGVYNRFLAARKLNKYSHYDISRKTSKSEKEMIDGYPVYRRKDLEGEEMEMAKKKIKNRWKLGN